MGRIILSSSRLSLERGSSESEMIAGLSAQEAARRLAELGSNSVPEEREHWLRPLAQHLWAPVPWMLEVTIALQIAVGKWTEALMITALLFFNVVISMIQKSRANSALELLKRRLSLTGRVKRDGEWLELASAELVPGDVVQLSLGKVVPADARILQGSVLLDQSSLTGESLAIDVGVGKTAYAGALIRRGEAIAEITATGTSTYFGRAAELVRIAHVESSELKVVLGLVRNLSIVNVALVLGLAAYGEAIALPTREIILLVLTAMLSAVPVALPATFTLAAALGAKRLALKNVLLTRLAALNEAAMIDVVCTDKTGTLTKNALAVAKVQPVSEGWTPGDVLGFAALASSVDGQDLVDVAIRAAARATPPSRSLPSLVSFTPFDPAAKLSQATTLDEAQREFRICKGAPAAVARLAVQSPQTDRELEKLARDGYRILVVASGPPGKMTMVGLVALSDPPRPDAAVLLAELESLSVHTVMVTGDAPPTASTLAHLIGLNGRVCPPGQISASMSPDDFAIFAGVYPEDKFHLVKAFQSEGHAVGMCGDGANDAPALRQAQLGIAVSTATDIAKAAASVVLTQPGLEGIVTTIKEGRAIFQRVLSYTLGILINKCVVLLVLGVGLLLTKRAILTPMLQALSMLTNDFVNMARTADRATPSQRPNVWRMHNMVLAAIPLASFKVLFCVSVIGAAWLRLDLNNGQMQTLTFIMFVFTNQAVLYVLRERGRMWQSRPATVMMMFSVLDIALVSTLAAGGILMPSIPLGLVVMVFGATAVFAIAMDQLKVPILRRFPID